ncbi:MAG: AraC family transcriptional regulator [Bacteroidetes bacterium]|nr:AraC family transcriptional regulator [Bacteroidota bacterium]
MKAVYEQVQPGQGESLLYKKISLSAFDAPFHFHPELELTYILKGGGMRYVGMVAEAFVPGDLVLLGPNLPHCWINQPEADGGPVEACVIQFGENLLRGTMAWPEFAGVARLLNHARGGLVFRGTPGRDLLGRLEGASPPRRLLHFLDLLLELAEAPYHILIETDAVYEDQQRFRLIFAYLIAHFRERIELEEVADLVGLTPTSFCHYFRKVTGKTLFEVVLHYRLEATVQLLLRTTRPVNEIAFESGFESIPHFNRVFKKWKGVSPKKYRLLNAAR